MITLTPTLPAVPVIDASQTTSARKLEWPSELPPSEPQGQCERSRLVTGSLPVSSAEALCRDWKKRIKIARDLRGLQRKHGNKASSRRWRTRADAIEQCMEDLRRELERANVRQPEENSRDEPDGGDTAMKPQK